MLLEAAVEGLPADNRAVILLRDAEGHSYQEIAEALDRTVVNVKARLHPARSSRSCWRARSLRPRAPAERHPPAKRPTLPSRSPSIHVTNTPLEASEGLIVLK